MSAAIDAARVGADFCVAAARALFWGVLAALVPPPERDRIRIAHGVHPPRWSFGLGLFQGFFGVSHFVWGALLLLEVTTADQGYLLLLNWWPGLETTHFQGLGVVNLFAWVLHPASWPFQYCAACGLIRCVVFAASREAVADPLVLLALRGMQHRRRARAQAAWERELGPLRPDRSIEEGGRLVVLTCREKPEWTDTVTISVADRFYRVADVEERPDGEHRVLAYALEELPANRVIRGYSTLSYHAPASGPAGRSGASAP